MGNVLTDSVIFRNYDKKDGEICSVINLSQAKINTEYIIKDIKTNDEDLKNFLFTLGCYKGEEIAVISVLSENYIISVKDARYSIDKDLAKVIIV